MLGQIDRRLLFGFMPTWSTDVNNPPPGFDEQMVAKMANAYTQSMRQSFNWDLIEPNPPQGGQHTYVWDSFDTKVTLATAKGIEPIGLIVATPDWANPGNPAPEAFKLPDEAHQGDFTAFCQAVASRYQGKIRYYEFWNEPNYGEMTFDLNEYTKWLGRAHQAVQSGNSAALLAVGGLEIASTARGDNDPDPGRADTSELQTIYSYIEDQGHSPDNYFDAVCLHPYEWRPDFAGIPPINIDGVEAHYELMATKQDGDKTVWITEYGWGMDTWSEQQQSNWLTTSLDLLTSANRSYLAIATFHLFADHEKPGPVRFGVCRADLTERPAYNTFRDYAAPRTPRLESRAPLITSLGP